MPNFGHRRTLPWHVDGVVRSMAVADLCAKDDGRDRARHAAVRIRQSRLATSTRQICNSGARS